MKIKAPVTNSKEALASCLLGADELFCGFEPVYWRKKFPELCISQRGKGASFTVAQELEKTVSTARRFGVKVHVAFNAFLFLENQYSLILRAAKDAVSLGADGLILSDPGLFGLLRSSGIKGISLIAGCDTVPLNSSTAALFKELGATRVVLDRAMTIAEMKKAVQGCRGIEYETFIMHNLCFFVDGLCASCKTQPLSSGQPGHRQGEKLPSFCRSRFKKQTISLKNGTTISCENNFSFWRGRRFDGCGACALFEFGRMGIDSLKILDRSSSPEKKLKALGFIKECLRLLQVNKHRKSEFMLACRMLFKKTFGFKCDAYDCYYPSASGRLR